MEALPDFLNELLHANSVLIFLGAFFAGSLTAAAPCSLVAVPLLVGSAIALNKDLKGRKKVFYTYIFTLLFVLGVAVSFSVLGIIVAKFGGFFSVAPTWAYVTAGVVSTLIALYAFGLFGEFDKGAIVQKLLPFRLFGAFLIGILFGLVSTPCASAPLFAIITLAQNGSYIYAYALILTFALGHSLLLLAAGISVGFAQSVVSSQTIAKLSGFVNKVFAVVLIGFGIYFFYNAWRMI